MQFYFTFSDQTESFSTTSMKPSVEEDVGSVYNDSTCQNVGDVDVSQGAEDALGSTPLGAMTPPAGGAGTLLCETGHQLRTPPSKNLDAKHDEDAPLRFKALIDILGPGSHQGRQLELCRNNYS
jgi:hypothetical protein